MTWTTPRTLPTSSATPTPPHGEQPQAPERAIAARGRTAASDDHRRPRSTTASRVGAERLDDLAPGGHPVHGLLDDEIAEIVWLFHQWGETDRSHRKLAHCGSSLERVSPATLRRVLLAEGLRLRPLPRPAQRPPAVTVIEDLVSRKWLGEVASTEETSVQVQAAFCQAMEPRAHGASRRPAGRHPRPCPRRPARPILLALSDNAPADDLRIHPRAHGAVRHPPALRRAWHADRPGVDRVAVRPHQGRAEYPHLLAIGDPATPRAELASAREHYNSVRLHAGIGYVTPNDEHDGRGPAIRKACEAGLEQARLRRIASHRAQQQPDPARPAHDLAEEPSNVG